MTAYVSIKFPSCEERMPLDEREWSREKQTSSCFLDVSGLHGRAGGCYSEFDLVTLLGNACA